MPAGGGVVGGGAWNSVRFQYAENLGLQEDRRGTRRGSGARLRGRPCFSTPPVTRIFRFSIPDLE